MYTYFNFNKLLIQFGPQLNLKNPQIIINIIIFIKCRRKFRYVAETIFIEKSPMFTSDVHLQNLIS